MKSASSSVRGSCARISHFIADSQYYSEEIFKAIRRYGAEPVIPHSSKVKEPLINLYVTKRFRLRARKGL
jgi:hypothetical protein